MAKVEVYERTDGGRMAFIWCPGCEMNHVFYLDKPADNGAIWTFDNNDLERPSFSPSMLVFANTPECRCHSFVKDGKIQFLSDCAHKLANQTVELPEYKMD